MGADGGSIPTRADMVRTKGYVSAQHSGQGGMGFTPNSFVRAAPDTVDGRTSRRLKLRTCALTNEPLGGFVVASRAGYLFNKESILRRLLERKTMPLPAEFADHISSLKDIVNVTLVSTCPVTKKDLTDGSTGVIVFDPCGCMVSQKAVDIMKSSSVEICLACNKPAEGIIKLTPDETEFKSQLETAKGRKSKRRRDDDKPAENVEKRKQSTEKPEVFKKLFH
jgi:hypothetical protein